ncbi:MAG TPA: hypothetical protein VF601_11240 [Beijerinckiaceae bacterium]|jgi:hypothetical protein
MIRKLPIIAMLAALSGPALAVEAPMPLDVRREGESVAEYRARKDREFEASWQARKGREESERQALVDDLNRRVREQEVVDTLRRIETNQRLWGR